MYVFHFSGNEKICGCCVNLGKPIVGTNKWASLQELVNFNVAERNVFANYSGKAMNPS